MAESGRPAPADRSASELAGLARRGASGAIEISGRPGGIIYLNRGRLTFAESPAVPDLGTRLVRSGRLQPEAWDRLIRQSRPDGAVAAALIAGGIATEAGLQQLLQSVTLDAMLALTTPFAGQGSVAGTWFAPRRSHWAEAVLAMDVTSVQAYLEHMTQRLAWYNVTSRWCPRLSGAGRPDWLVHRDQRAIVGRIDGRTTVGELAWRGGFALHETMESVGRLVHAGLCTVTVPDAAPVGSAPVPVPPAARGIVPEPARASLPQRSHPGDGGLPPLTRATRMDFALLQRVRQGLQQMS